MDFHVDDFNADGRGRDIEVEACGLHFRTRGTAVYLLDEIKMNVLRPRRVVQSFLWVRPTATAVGWCVQNGTRLCKVSDAG